MGAVPAVPDGGRPQPPRPREGCGGFRQWFVIISSWSALALSATGTRERCEADLAQLEQQIAAKEAEAREVDARLAAARAQQASLAPATPAP